MWWTYCNWSFVPIFAQFWFGALAVMRWHSFQVRKFCTYFWAQRSKKWVALVALRKIWCSWGNEPFCCKIQYYYYYDFKPYRKKPLQKMKIKNIKNLHKRFSFLLVKLTGHLLELGWGWKKIKLCTFIRNN